MIRSSCPRVALLLFALTNTALAAPDDATPASPAPVAPSPSAATVPSAASETAVAPAVAASPPGTASTQARAPSITVGQHFAQVVDTQNGLTAAQAARRAARTSIEAETKVEATRSADAAIDQTMWRALPRVTLSARYARLSPVTNASFGPGQGSLVGTASPGGVLPADAVLFGIDSSALTFPVLLNNYSLNAGLVVPLSDYLFSTTQAIRGAKAARESTLVEQQVARIKAGAEAKLAYYGWVRAKLQQVLAGQTLAQAQARKASIEKLYAAGRAAQADVLQADAFVAENELVIQRTQTATLIGEQRLRIAMHADPAEQLVVGEDIMLEDTRPPEADVEALFREGLKNRMELKMLERTDYALSQAIQVQDAGAYPRVEAFANAAYANPNQRIFPQTAEFRGTWDVGVQATWTVTDLGLASANSRQTVSQRAQLMSQKHAIEDSLRLEIVSALQSMAEARQAIESAKHAERAAEAAYQARELLFQHGRATSLEVLQAETSRFQARLSLLDAHIAQYMGQVQLEHALGRDNDLGM